MKTKHLGIAPTLVVTVLVLGLALLVGVILLMMYIRTGIEHSPEQTSIEIPHVLPSVASQPRALNSGATYL